MRVVEPKQFTKKPRARRSKKPLLLITVFLVAAFSWFATRDAGAPVENAQNQEVESNVDDQATPNDELERTDDGVKTLRKFTDNEFKLFYDNLLQPNLSRVENSPVITGNIVADTRIRDIAEARGYRLRSSPTVPLASVDGSEVQKEVVEPWRKLKAAATAAGLNLSLSSGYRSVDYQRTLFLQRLSVAGATTKSIADGYADELVNEVLITTALPGYSKHHTGYTIDLQCGGYAFENFKNSPCNDWMSAENYRIPKELGFIPSYPPLADAQGPDPEAWEYVWVGTDPLYE